MKDNLNFTDKLNSNYLDFIMHLKFVSQPMDLNLSLFRNT